MHDQNAAPYQILKEVMDMAVAGSWQTSSARFPRSPDSLRAPPKAVTEPGMSGGLVFQAAA